MVLSVLIWASVCKISPVLCRQVLLMISTNCQIVLRYGTTRPSWRRSEHQGLSLSSQSSSGNRRWYEAGFYSRTNCHSWTGAQYPYSFWWPCEARTLWRIASSRSWLPKLVYILGCIIFSKIRKRRFVSDEFFRLVLIILKFAKPFIGKAYKFNIFTRSCSITPQRWEASMDPKMYRICQPHKGN